MRVLLRTWDYIHLELCPIERKGKDSHLGRLNIWKVSK